MIAPARTVNDVVWFFAPREGGTGLFLVLSSTRSSPLHECGAPPPRPVYGPRPWIEVGCGRSSLVYVPGSRSVRSYECAPSLRFFRARSSAPLFGRISPSARVFPCLAPTMSPTRLPFPSSSLLTGSSGRGPAAVGASSSRRLLLLRVRTSGTHDPVHSHAFSPYGIHAYPAVKEGR